MMVHQRAALYKIMISFTLATDRSPTREERADMIKDVQRLSRDECIDVILLTEQVIDKQVKRNRKRKVH